jgi:twitching motility protein PilT
VSDIHLCEGEPFSYTELGLDVQTPMIVTREMLQGFAQEVRIDIEKQGWDGGWAEGGLRYRINAARSEGRIDLTLRLLPKEVPTPEEVRIPQAALEAVMRQKDGLVLVNGITGSGKSTTCAAFLMAIVKDRSGKLITIEDPIEYQFVHPGRVIRQRAVGEAADVSTFAMALRASLRQAPKTIFIGEIRDAETAETVIHAVSSGHLVISTMHTSSVDQTVQRFLQNVTDARQAYCRDVLADMLRVVICQKLVRTKDDRRAAVHQVLINNPQFATHIREGQPVRLLNELELHIAKGCQTWEMGYDRLVNEDLISLSDVPARKR